MKKEMTNKLKKTQISKKDYEQHQDEIQDPNEDYFDVIKFYHHYHHHYQHQKYNKENPY